MHLKSVGWLPGLDSSLPMLEDTNEDLDEDWHALIVSIAGTMKTSQRRQ
jgi:hypothetical protein